MKRSFLSVTVDFQEMEGREWENKRFRMKSIWVLRKILCIINMHHCTVYTKY